MTFHMLWLLCGLGAAVFATHVASGATRTFAARSPTWIALAAGFVLAALWLRSGRAVDASWVGGLVAAVAAWQLVRPGRSAVMTLAAGALAALWASLIQVQGLPQSAAMAVGAALLLASAALAERRPNFAPSLLREEGLVVVLVIAVVVAVAPVVSQGWQSALALNLTDTSATTVIFPAWMLSFIGASIALGGLWSLWRRG